MSNSPDSCQEDVPLAVLLDEFTSADTMRETAQGYNVGAALLSVTGIACIAVGIIEERKRSGNNGRGLLLAGAYNLATAAKLGLEAFDLNEKASRLPAIIDARAIIEH